ncbi:hypothetical protein AYJ58_19475 [Shewanella sp. Pdp11]|nr:hypothetical protein AYJ58_19475 [Shewanella sp. Pdp11]
MKVGLADAYFISHFLFKKMGINSGEGRPLNLQSTCCACELEEQAAYWQAMACRLKQRVV